MEERILKDNEVVVVGWEIEGTTWRPSGADGYEDLGDHIDTRFTFGEGIVIDESWLDQAMVVQQAGVFYLNEEGLLAPIPVSEPQGEETDVRDPDGS